MINTETDGARPKDLKVQVSVNKEINSIEQSNKKKTIFLYSFFLYLQSLASSDPVLGSITVFLYYVSGISFI